MPCVAIFAYGGSYLRRLGSGELQSMVSDLRFMRRVEYACVVECHW